MKYRTNTSEFWDLKPEKERVILLQELGITKKIKDTRLDYLPTQIRRKVIIKYQRKSSRNEKV